MYHFGGERRAAGRDRVRQQCAPRRRRRSNPASLIGGGVKLHGQRRDHGARRVASLRCLPDKGATFSAWVRIEAPQSDAYVLEMADAESMRSCSASTARRCSRDVAHGRAGRGERAVGRTCSRRAVAPPRRDAAAAGRVLCSSTASKSAATPVELAEIAGALTIGASAAGAQLLRPARSTRCRSRTSRAAPNGCRRRRAARDRKRRWSSTAAMRRRKGGDVSYFAVTMQNVTVDGWVVIVILAVMFVIALLIMISKARVPGARAEGERRVPQGVRAAQGRSDGARQARERRCARAMQRSTSRRSCRT